MAGDRPIGNPHTEDRDGRGRYTRTIERAEQDAQAARLRAQHWTYKAIAEHLGYACHTGAREAVRRALRDACVGPAQELVEMEAARLEAMYDEVLDILQADHIMVSHGKVVYDAAGNPLPDYDIKLRAVDRALRARESFRKLFGLDQPAKVEARVTEVTQEDIELAKLIREAQAKNAADEAAIKGEMG